MGNSLTHAKGTTKVTKMPKPPPINGKWVTSHENAAIGEDINDLN